MLLRKIVPTTKERMLFASVIVIAANSGGAWSPIGDVTTIMLWMKGNVSSAKLIESLLLPPRVARHPSGHRFALAQRVAS